MHVAGIVVHGEHEHLCVGGGGLECWECIDSRLVGHRDVEDDGDIWFQVAGFADGVVGVAGFSGTFDVVFSLEQQTEACADDCMVVDDENADHETRASATIVVPAPGEDSIFSVPSRSSRRSRTPVNPRRSSPVSAGENPRPSSSIRTATVEPFRARRF